MTRHTPPSNHKVLNERLTLAAGCAAFLLTILWGGNNVAIKFALAGVPSFALAGIRFVLGFFIVLIWALWSRVPLSLEDGERRGIIRLAFLFVLQICLLNVGINNSLAGRTTVLIATHPFFIALFAHFMIQGDRLSRLKTVGMMLSFLGVIFVFAESIVLKDFRYLGGDLLVLLSSLLLGFRLVYIKILTQGIHPARLLLWQAGLSIPVFFLLSFLFERDFPYQFDSGVIFGILYQGVMVGGIGFIVLTLLFKRYIASRVGVFQFITPVFGVLFSNLLLGEGLSFGLMASMVLVGTGIAIVNYES